MRILITGGAGYIGTELIYRLIAEKGISEISVYDNLSRKNYNLFLHKHAECNKIKFIRGDILDSRKLKSTLQGIDVVFHLAAKVSTPFSNEDPHSFEQVNHWGTAELVYAVEASDVKIFIYASSTAIYGSSSNIADENTLPNPDTFYGTSKLNGENHVKRLFNKMKAHIIRCGNVYGYSPTMRFDAVINRFMFEANFFNRISVNGNGLQTRSFIPVDKIPPVFAGLLADNCEIPPGTYNLVDKNLSVLELVETIKEIYQGVEVLYTNQNAAMRELKVNTNGVLSKHFNISRTSLKDELLIFKDKFAFS